MCARALGKILVLAWHDLRRFAEAIEKREKNDSESRSDERVHEKMDGEQGSGMIQKHPLGERQDGLMEVKE